MTLRILRRLGLPVDVLRRPLGVAALILTQAGAFGAAQAGTVDVQFQGVDQYTDAGRMTRDREEAVKTLEAHFAALAPRLPAPQRLAITVTDVDLAGESDWLRGGRDVRVLRGRADWPRLTLSYVLYDGEREISRGQARLSDPSYLVFGGGLQREAPLPYEKRMIDRWFTDTLAPAAAH